MRSTHRVLQPTTLIIGIMNIVGELDLHSALTTSSKFFCCSIISVIEKLRRGSFANWSAAVPGLSCCFNTLPRLAVSANNPFTRTVVIRLRKSYNIRYETYFCKQSREKNRRERPGN